VIVGVKPRLIGRDQLMRAMRAALGEALDNPIRIGGQRPEYMRLVAARRSARFGLRPCEGGTEEF
jgi:hypothetical protein